MQKGSIIANIQLSLLLSLFVAGHATSRTTILTYDNSSYYTKGLLLSEEVGDGATTFTKKLNSYQAYGVVNGNANTSSGVSLPVSSAVDDGSQHYFPGLSLEASERRETGSGSSVKRSEVTYGYDSKGNVIRYNDLGDTNTSDDDIQAFITYYGLPAPYIMDVPSSITIKNGAGLILRQRENTINGTGDVTQIRQLLADGSKAIYDMSYDSLGNLETMTHPANVHNQRMKYSYTYDPEVQIYVTSVEDSFGYGSSNSYDYRYGALLSTTDLNLQTIKYSLDKVGRIATITGPLELAANKLYTLRFEYHPEAAVAYARTQHYDDGRLDLKTDSLETILFIDGLGRVIQTKKDIGAFAGIGSNDKEMMQVSGWAHYDALGRVVSQYQPTSESKGRESTLNQVRASIIQSQTSYDAIDRALTQTLADGSVTQSSYTLANDNTGKLQQKTRVTAANGNMKDSYRDMNDRITAITDYPFAGNTTKQVWTNYRYNPLDEITAVVDAKSNSTTSTYDNLGRRLTITNPDMGTTTYKYDLAGNLLEKGTSNLASSSSPVKTINYDYQYSRLSKISYPQNTQNNVTYYYGRASTASTQTPYNRAGRLVLRVDGSGGEEFYYDALGNTTKSVRTIRKPKTWDVNYKAATYDEPQSYTTQWQYDTWSRLKNLTYPDGEQVKFSYNPGGLLAKVSGTKQGTNYSYINQLGYDLFEQRTYLKLGNGTESFYSYDPKRRWLNNLKTETSGSLASLPNRLIMNNNYSYDEVGNITQLSNAAATSTTNGGSTSNTYTYNGNDELLTASGNWNGSTTNRRYALNFTYDDIHNIVTKVQTDDTQAKGASTWTVKQGIPLNNSYTYASGKPHAASKIGDRTFTYDANGNQMGWINSSNNQIKRSMNWDEENRLQSVSDATAATTYAAQQYSIYDANGERATKSSLTGTTSKTIQEDTIYVNPYLVVKATGPTGAANYTKHYFIESQRMTTKLANTTGTPLDTNNPKLAAVAGAETASSLDTTQYPSFTPPTYGKIRTGSPTANTTTGSAETTQFFYHPDHIGSSSYITDSTGDVYQHLEYLPSGESWISEFKNGSSTGTDQPYKYTGKELDADTQLYYYGARYYDPRTSVWQSPDPILGQYMQGQPNGGVYTTENLALYTYVGNSPITATDPDGRSVWTKVAKVAYHVAKGGNATAAFAGNIQDARTLFNPKASASDRIIAGLSLASEFAPISLGDVKDAAKITKGITKKAEQVAENAANGKRREATVTAVLKKEYPDAKVQNQQYLRTADGEIAKDANGKGRIVDHAVIQDGQAKTFETTSMTANKTAQIKKEENIFGNGGTYIRDRDTRELVPVQGVSEIKRIP